MPALPNDPPPAARSAAALPEVNCSEEGNVRFLHLSTPWVQGTMKIDAPFEIELEYVQRMMVWLLFVEPATLRERHAMQLGLGAASLTKFCHKKAKLGRTTAVELNPQVLAACRGWFKLPPEDARLEIVLADAREEIRNPRWIGAVDALQVDLYDDDAAAPVLDTEAAYADCRALLTDDGCMTVNLFGRSASLPRSLEKIAAVFGEQALWQFKPTREGNTVVLAQRTPSRPPREVLAQRADFVQSRLGLPALKWLRGFKPLVKL